MSRFDYGSSTKDSTSRYPPISSTVNIATIMVHNPSIVEKSVLHQLRVLTL